MSIALPATHGTVDANQTTRSRPANDHNQNDQTPLFSRDELRQFAADDAQAGRIIGKILSALFIYTMVAMGVAIWWTFRTVGH